MTADNTGDLPDLTFFSNLAGENEGLGHAGIETYRDSPYASTARETGQNSNDARKTKPVRLSFNVFNVAIDDLPGSEKLRTSVEKCLEKVNTSGTKREVEFFKRAHEILAGDTIPILGISDYNTVGLTGPCIEGTRFHALLKGAGVSSDKADDAGGSFGIGKNAPFALSDIQTVFYSTIYLEQDSGKEMFLAQGKSILVSHTDIDDKPCRATALWGLGYEPVKNPEVVPRWMRRSEPGTSVFVTGFPGEDAWQERFACSLMMNFFGAVSAGDLEFSIDNGSIVINSASIAGLFQTDRLINAARSRNRFDQFQQASQMLECLMSDDAEVTEVKIENLGQIGIRVLVGEGYPKRMGILRNGMAITDTLENFGDSFQRFPLYRDFVATVTPLGTEGSALIRRLENPRHDSLSAERIKDPELRSQVRSAMQELAGEIRNAIKICAKQEHGAVVDADEMAHYFADTGTVEPDAPESPEDDPEAIRYDPVRSKRRAKPDVGADKGETGGGGRNGGGDGGGDGNGEGDGPGNGSSRRINITGFRIPSCGDHNDQRRRLWFTPSSDGTILIKLKAVGVNSDEDLTVEKSSAGIVVDGAVQLDVTNAERTSLDVTFDKPCTGPIEPKITAFVDKGDST